MCDDNNVELDQENAANSRNPVVVTVGALALACCTTLPWRGVRQGSGRVVDEAMCVGRTAASFPPRRDYFRDMDYGATRTGPGAATRAPYVPASLRPMRSAAIRVATTGLYGPAARPLRNICRWRVRAS
jgi:hypothetical protein